MVVPTASCTACSSMPDARLRGWLERRCANTCEEGKGEREPKAVYDNQPGECGSADDIRQNDACLTGPSIRDGSEERPQHQSWDDVGEQHEADRPWRIETLESENEQRDESGTVTQRRLAERNEETSSARLMRNEVKNLPHQLACGA